MRTIQYPNTVQNLASLPLRFPDTHPLFVAIKVLETYSSLAEATEMKGRGVPAAVADSLVPATPSAVQQALDILQCAVSSGTGKAIALAELHWRILCANSVRAKEERGVARAEGYKPLFVELVNSWTLARPAISPVPQLTSVAYTPNERRATA